MRRLVFLGALLLGSPAWAWNCWSFSVIVYPTNPAKRVRLDSRQFGSFEQCDQALDQMVYLPGTTHVRPNVKIIEACIQSECTICN